MSLRAAVAHVGGKISLLQLNEVSLVACRFVHALLARHLVRSLQPSNVQETLVN